MKSFLTPVLLSLLLLLSITLKELSGEELECYSIGFGQTIADEEIKTCNGTNLACATAVDIKTGKPKLKGCSSEAGLDALCSNARMLNAKCNDYCKTKLCNNEK